MAKYRVCEMVDGNGNVWWQVARVVCWFFFEWDRDWTFGVSRTLPKTVNKFDSKDEALHRVEELERRDKAQRVRVAAVIKPTKAVVEPTPEPEPEPIVAAKTAPKRRKK